MMSYSDNPENDLISIGYKENKDRELKGIFREAIAPVLEAKGQSVDDYDTDYIVDNKIQTNFSEENLLDISSEEGKDWVNAAKILYESQAGGKDQSELPYGLQKIMEENKPKTDEEFAQWGIEHIGWFQYNFPVMGADIANVKAQSDENPRAALALWHMTQQYEELPKMTWKGTKRFFKGVLSDPSSYVGIGTFGYGLIARNSSKETLKGGFKEYVKRKLLSPSMLLAYEAGGYSALDNTYRQQLGITANEAAQNMAPDADVSGIGQESFNFGELAASTGIGAAAGGTIGKAGELVAKGAEIAAPKIGEAVSTATDATRQFFINQGKLADIRIKEQGEGTKLMSGFDPTDFINEGLSKLGKSLDDTVKPDNLGYIFKSEKAVLETPQQKGDVSQWKGIFEKAGIKQDEMKWLGLNEFFEGKQTVTKEEIAEHIAQNKFHLDEVELLDPDNVNRRLVYDDADSDVISSLEKSMSNHNQYLKDNSNEHFLGDNYEYVLDIGFDENDALNNGMVADINGNKYIIVKQKLLKNGQRVHYKADGNIIAPYHVHRITTNADGTEKAESHGSYQSVNEAMVQTESLAMRFGDMVSENNSTKFQRFTEPGGTNYREIILTNPNFNKNKEGEASFTYNSEPVIPFTYNSDPELRDYSATMAPFTAEMERLNKRIYEIDHRMAEMGIQPNSQNRTLLQPTGSTPEGIERNNLVKERRELLDEHDSVSREKTQTGARILQRQNFTAPSHWGDIENPVVHARISDRVAEDGGKILYIEEAQSDWGQRGRQKRYATGEDAMEAHGITSATSNTRPEMTSSGFAEEIPRGPLVEKTEQFTKAIVRRLIKKAVDEGYDYVSLSTGQVQAARWGETGLIPYYDEILPGIMDKVVGELQEGKQVQFDNAFTKIDSDRDATNLLMQKNKKLKNVGLVDVDAGLSTSTERITIKITDEMRASVEKGMPMFELGAAAGGMGIGAAIANQEENPI